MLVTRSADSAIETAHALRARGWRPVFAPVAAIERIDVDLPRAEQVQALLVTSANALAMLPAAYFHVPLFAVGDATESRARALGFTATRSAAGDAEALAALAVAGCAPSGGPLLHVCGREAPATLGSILADLGFEVLRREAYLARPAARLPEAARGELARGMVAAALFFSPATARRFVALLRHDMPPEVVPEMLRDVTAIAISAAAADALTPLPWRRIRVASRPNQDELLAQLP